MESKKTQEEDSDSETLSSIDSVDSDNTKKKKKRRLKKKAKAKKAQEEAAAGGGSGNTMAPQPNVQINATSGGLNKAPTASRAFQGTAPPPKPAEPAPVQ